MLSILLAGFSSDQSLYDKCDNLELKSEKYNLSYSDFIKENESITASEFKEWGDKFWDVVLKCSNKVDSHLFSEKAMALYANLNDPNLIESKLNELSIHHPAKLSILKYWENLLTLGGPNESNAYIEKLSQISKNTNSDVVKLSAKVHMADWYYKNNYRNQSENIIYQISENEINYVPYLENKLNDISKKLGLLQVGVSLPEFREKMINGEIIDNEDLYGKFTFIYFYGSTCGSCVSMYPILNKIEKNYDSDKFRIIGVGNDWQAEYGFNTKKEYLEFSKKYGIEWSQISRNQLWKEFNISRLSTGLLINPEGVLVRVSNSDSASDYKNEFYAKGLEEIVQELID